VRIALAQVDCTLGDIDANVARAREAIGEARDAGSDLVVFPELSLTGYSVGTVGEDLTLEPTDPRIEELAERAGDMGLLVGFHEGGSALHTYNSAAYFESGELLRLHRKLYLPTYEIFEERKHFSPGQSLHAFETRFGRMATLICNDAWQPALTFLAVQDGARMLIVPSNSAQSVFPDRYDNRSYWRDITVFTARMYQCFVVFVNRVGVERDGQLKFWGGSHVVGPWGHVIDEAPATGEERLLTVDVNLDEVRHRRREVPLVKEARLGLLRREIERLIAEGGDL
jgi:predicted amidohydrolase